MKISIVVGGNLVPQSVDDPTIEHDSVLLIQDEKMKYRVLLGLHRDAELSKPYMPYWSRALSLEKVIYLRDHLTKLIEECQKETTE